MNKKTLLEIKEEILLLMEYAVNEEDMAAAIVLVEKHETDRIALNIFHEFYSFLPEAENDAVLILRNLDSKSGAFIIAVTSVNDHYLYIATQEGAQFLGRHAEGIWDQEVLDLLGLNHEDALKKFKELDAFSIYVPAHLNKNLCAVCSAANGEVHRFGCPVEICPWCQGQLTNCNCRFTQVGVDQLKSERQIEIFFEMLEEKGRVPFNAKDQSLSFAKGTD